MVMQHDEDADDTWQQLAAPTARLLEKQKPETEKKTPEENHSSDDSQRETQRGEVIREQRAKMVKRDGLTKGSAFHARTHDKYAMAAISLRISHERAMS